MSTDSQQKTLPVSGPVSGPTPSPCVRNCCLNDADQCLGCGRLLVEILAWGNASEARRQEIAGKAKVRRQ